MKRKNKEIEETDAMEVEEQPKNNSGDDSDAGEAMEAEEEKVEKMEKPEENGKSAENGEREVFKVLGKPEMKNLEALKVTSSWVQHATTFSATIDSSTSEKLSKIQIPAHLTPPTAISTWFPVQYAVLPNLLSEIRTPPPLRPRDVAIAAPTGSGKTLCFVVPALAAVGENSGKMLKVIVLAPVQTLVAQIVEEFSKWNQNDSAKITALSGAADFDKEARSLISDPPNIIVATPARLVQHLTSTIPPPISLKNLRYLIVDEADRMGKLMREEWLNLVEFLSGNMERVSCLNDVIRQRRAPQKIVLSATLSKDVEELHLWNLFKPKLFSATASKASDISTSIPEIDHISGRLALPSSISHRLLISDAKFHPLAVYQQIRLQNFNRTLIFVNEVASSNRLAHVLKNLAHGEFEVDYFTAQLFGKRRFKMLEKFNKNEKRVMICSDVLARGTDLNEVDCVVNYNLPKDDKLFVHRAGRTGRAGREGTVISVGDKETKRLFVKMLKVTNLYGNTVEENLESYQFEKDMERYTSALESLKSLVTSQEKGGKMTTRRSGFEAKRKSRPNKKGEKPWLKKKTEN